MTSAQHLASHVAAHTRSLGADIPALFRRIPAAFRARIARSGATFHAADTLAAAGYTVMSIYAAGLAAHIATVY
jgi:hypothetical protein